MYVSYVSILIKIHFFRLIFIVTRTLNEKLQKIHGSFVKKKKFVCQLNFSVQNWISIRPFFSIVLILFL